MGLWCYTDQLPLPPFLLHIILFLSYTHRALTWALRAVGLALLIDDDTDFYTPAPPPHYHQTPLPSGRPALPISLSVIRQALPSSRYEPKDEREESKPDSCSVCLFELEVGDEVRRLGGCFHIFHACCIDRWVGIGRRTCPLCRAQIIQQELLQKVMTGAAGKLSMDGSSTDLLDLYLTPSETDYYDDGLYYGDDGDYYPLL